MTTSRTARQGAFFLIATLFCWGCGEPESSAPETSVSEVRYVGVNELTGGANAVIASGAALAHTAQFFPIGGDDASEQADEVLDSIDKALEAAGSSLQQVVKLNVYVSGSDVVESVKAVIVERFDEGARPAICLAESALMNTSALVAMDAVATASDDPGAGVVALRNSAAMAGKEGAHHVGVLPTGTRIYVAGRAARKGTVAEATDATMLEIKDTLAFLGLGIEHIVHVKSFMKPISEMGAAEDQLIKFFDGKAPPMAFIEWTNNNPIEIEVIATSPDELQSIPIEYLSPPGERVSPVYSRIAKVYHPATIYISGLWGSEGADGVEQIHEIFASMKEILGETGTDLDHLAKATYYPANDDLSRQLNEIRPEYYDPQRPPSASKALVVGTGFAGRSITLDMIAVPSR